MRKRVVITRAHANVMSGVLARYLVVSDKDVQEGFRISGVFSYSVVKNSAALAEVNRDTAKITLAALAGTKAGEFAAARTELLEELSGGGPNMFGNYQIPHERMGELEERIAQIKERLEITKEDEEHEVEQAKKVQLQRVDVPLVLVSARDLPPNILPSAVDVLLPMIEEE